MDMRLRLLKFSSSSRDRVCSKNKIRAARLGRGVNKGQYLDPEPILASVYARDPFEDVPLCILQDYGTQRPHMTRLKWGKIGRS